MSYLKGIALFILLMFAPVQSVTAENIPQPVVDWMEANTVKVYVGTGTGSGFFINPTTVVTACHVAGKWKTIYISPEGTEERFPAQVVKCDEEADLAVLKLEDNLPETVHTVLAKENPRIGFTTYGGGFPLGLPLSIFEGHWQRQGSIGQSYMNSTHVVPGDSGGPLVIWEDGEVKIVGVRTGMYEAGPPGNEQVFPNLSFIEDITILRPFLGEYYIDENI